MDLQEAKRIIEIKEKELPNSVFVIIHTFERDGKKLYLAITERLKKKCRRSRIWKSKPFLTAFKNAEYGYDPVRAQSMGGSDGIFILTRNYKPKNEMMKKIFDRFLDKSDGLSDEIALEMKISKSDLIPVRLVSIDVQKALKLAIKFNIYAYDAYFLHCAKSLKYPLFTFDKRMKQVANELNVEILE